MEQNKTTICLSDEIKENFNEWLKSWDFKINSADNRDNLQKATEGCKAIINLSSKICNDIERKYLQKMNKEQNVEGLDFSHAIAKPILAVVVY